MINDGLKIRAISAEFRRRIDLGIWEESGDKRYIGKLEFTEVSERELAMATEPTASIPIEAAQALMDDLWHAGIRPIQEGTTGQLDATKRHLDDMRKIAFNKLRIEP